MTTNPSPGKWLPRQKPAGGLQGLLNVFRRWLGRPIVTEEYMQFVFDRPVRIQPGETVQFAVPLPPTTRRWSMADSQQDPRPWHIPPFYIGPMGLPLYWRNDMSGVLPKAVRAFIDHGADRRQPAPSAEQVKVLIIYLQHFIAAPCWDLTVEFAAETAELRRRVRLLDSLTGIMAWLDSAMAIGLDPF